VKQRADSLIITDTSPLITLAVADHLHALNAPGLQIVIPDAVFVEATRMESAPGVAAIVEWAARHDDLVRIQPTEKGLDQIRRIAEGRSIRGMGEEAAQEVMRTSAEFHPERFQLLLFEDRDLQKRTVILPERAFAISTGDWLRTLEARGLIQSADHILDQAARAGRTIERQRLQVSRSETLAAAQAMIAGASADDIMAAARNATPKGEPQR
jgi:hypothetical protein